MSRPRLLDLYCGAGGSAMGYHRAGFDVVGVDIKPQPHFPFEFHQADAMTYPLEGFDVIHASPPCQGYGWTKYMVSTQGKTYPLLIEETRRRLTSSGIPWIIENVPGAPLENPTILCGSMFSLSLRRHRLFESSVELHAPSSCDHQIAYGVYAGKVTLIGSHGVPYQASSGRTHWRPVNVGRAEAVQALGIDWMTLGEMAEAIPPAYTEFIGRQILP